MKTRIAVVSIIIENNECTENVNNILHEFNNHIIGRMGLPYAKRDISIICIVVDATNDVISALSGKLGMIKGVTTKTAYSRVFESNDTKK